MTPLPLSSSNRWRRDSLERTAAKTVVLAAWIAASFLLFHGGQAPSTIFSDIALRFPGVFGGILWAKSRLGLGWKETLFSSLRWGLPISIVTGFFFYTTVIPFLGTSISTDMPVRVLGRVFHVDMRAVFDIGFMNGLVNLPLNLGLATVFGEKKDVAEKSFFPNFLDTYLSTMPRHFVMWFPPVFAVGDFQRRALPEASFERHQSFVAGRPRRSRKR